MRLGYLNKSSLSALPMAFQADAKLLQAILSNHYHVLFPLFPPQKFHKYQVRSRGHTLVLPPKDDKNFIPHILYQAA